MEMREKANERRVRQGLPALKLHSTWTDRPKLNAAEWAIFCDFTDFAALCGGEITPQALLSWFDLKGVEPEHREWKISMYSRLSSVTREPAQQGEQ